jgi:hypothetical protein
LSAAVVTIYVRFSCLHASSQTDGLACALERYRLAHGQYPESLDALAPRWVAKVPADVIVGQPMRYHRTPDGRFVLWSVGWNGRDDGGAGSEGLSDPDWVWEPLEPLTT